MADNQNSIVSAIYLEQLLEEYQGNPLIEALPPILKTEQVVESLSDFPPFNASEREFEPNLRLHMVQRLFRFFQPTEHTLDLEQRISRAIRQGYLQRNPITKEENERIRKSYEAIQKGEYLAGYQPKHKRTALGFTIMGWSGIGKTTAIEHVLSLYSQTITHQTYKGEIFTFTQVSWLKLDCPFDGSLKGLCTSFFSALDRILGTDYLVKFGYYRNPTELMLQQIAHLSSFHGIGILVVDEIQHLKLSKNGGHEKMLNFFVTFVNIVGVPVVLVGTNKAASILQKEFRQARRGSGQGDMIWEKMQKNDTWDLIMEGMWEYQWTKKPTPYTPEWSEYIYEESQGILDIAIKLFMLAQMRAITDQSERLSKKIFKDVANDSLKLVKPMLDALKSGIPSEIGKYEDLRPIDMAMAMEKYEISGNVTELLRSRKEAKESGRQNEKQILLEEMILNFLEMDYDAKDVERAVTEAIKEQGEDSEKNIIHRLVSEKLMNVKNHQESTESKSHSVKKTVKKVSKNLLADTKNKVIEQNKTIHEGFVEEKLIKPLLDDIGADQDDTNIS